MQQILDRAADIKLVILDVDGVLTDGRLILGDDGQEYKAFNTKDGHGMKMLRSTGVEIGIITGRTSNVVALRMEGLGIEHLYQGQQDKLPAYEELKAKLGLKDEQVAYMGDDVVDLPIMCRVGLAVTVADAHQMAKQHAHWQTENKGGRGAVRELCDLILEAQGNLESLMERYVRTP
jgi:3-deoxy-D-manno-octulosonate 8-phosphate phosphatase (KDO 8-P phosphatase)